MAKKFVFTLDDLDGMVLRQIQAPTAPAAPRNPLAELQQMGRSPITTFVPKPLKTPALTQSVTEKPFPFLGGRK